MATPIPTFSSARLRRIWVKGELEARGRSFAQLAAENGWHRNAVSAAMMNPSLPQEEVIARALGTTPRILFPERYDAITGDRLHAVRDNRRAQFDDNINSDRAA